MVKVVDVVVVCVGNERYNVVVVLMDSRVKWFIGFFRYIFVICKVIVWFELFFLVFFNN